MCVIKKFFLSLLNNSFHELNAWVWFAWVLVQGPIFYSYLMYFFIKEAVTK